MRFVDDFFPLVVVMHEAHMDDVELREMAEGYEEYFKRNERYAVLVVSPGDFVRLGARERKRIAEWVNTPRVKEMSKRLCVGTATVVPSAIAYGALTALLWFWTPATPHRAVTTVNEGLDFCFRSLDTAQMTLTQPQDAIRRLIVEHLRSSGEYGPSLRRS